MKPIYERTMNYEKSALSRIYMFITNYSFTFQYFLNNLGAGGPAEYQRVRIICFYQHLHIRMSLVQNGHQT